MANTVLVIPATSIALEITLLALALALALARGISYLLTIAIAIAGCGIPKMLFAKSSFIILIRLVVLDVCCNCFIVNDIFYACC